MIDYLDNLKYKINNDIDLIEGKILRRLFKELMMEILNSKEREFKKGQFVDSLLTVWILIIFLKFYLRLNQCHCLIEGKILRRLFKELMMEILNLKERELKKRTIRRFIADSVDFNSLDIKISDEILKNINLYFKAGQL